MSIPELQGGIDADIAKQHKCNKYVGKWVDIGKIWLIVVL
jgi:hypothetical protein